MTNPQKKAKRGRWTAAFSLVEVALALGVAGFCLVPLMGLIPVGLSTNQSSIEQTTAASVSARIIADLRGASISGTSSFGFNIPQPGNAPSSQPQILYFSETGNPIGLVGNSSPILSGSTARYRANVGLISPAVGLKGATTVRILVTWPGFADQNNPSWPTHSLGSFEAVTAIVRNQ